MSRPDALFLPESMKTGKTAIQRLHSILRLADSLLEVTGGERCYVRRQPHNRLFITRNPADTILQPIGHPQAGQPRYRWEKRADGTELGWLL
jgi:hypothetical protein